MKKTLTALGIMTGTSVDGVDLALLSTDGVGYVEKISCKAVDFSESIKNKIHESVQIALQQGYVPEHPFIQETEKIYTDYIAESVNQFISEIQKPDIIGFHGQTILHRPHQKITWQLGDGHSLATQTACPVVYKFRHNDVQQGGQGAPLIPIYHQALYKNNNLSCPVVIINIGGVANLTFLNGEQMMAFDTGCGNGIIDNLMNRFYGKSFDKDGQTAASGQVDTILLQKILQHDWFKMPVPKSADRYDFTQDLFLHLPPQDAVATATALTAHSIYDSFKFLPVYPERIYLTGGGAYNKTIVQILKHISGLPVYYAEDLGSSSSFMEAEGFAYLAVRHLKGLPLSFPLTTGVSAPCTGGELCV